MRLHSPDRIEEYEEAGAWGDRTVLEQFDELIDEHPDRLALADPPNRPELTGHAPERLTYEELGESVGCIAAGLRDVGVEKDDVVVVQLPNTWELAALYLAVARAGGIISPLPVQWRRRELDHVAELTDADLFVTIEEFDGFDHAALGEASKLETVVTLDEVRDWLTGATTPGPLPEVPVGAHEIFNLQWTSGTTADPKACPMTHNNWFANPVPPQAEMQEGGRILCTAPLVNMTAVGVSFVPWLLTRSTMLLHHPFDAEVLLKQLMGEGVTFTTFVPALLARLLKHPKVDDFDFSHVETIVTGSAAPAPWTLEAFEERWGIEIINIWGQNEGTGIVSGPRTTPLSRRATDFPRLGHDTDWGLEDPRLTTIDTKVVDPDTGEELDEVGEVGELLYRGPFVMPEYFRQRELTEAAFDEGGYFRTGDLFRVEEDDFVSFFDRKKDVIIRGGYTISAKEVENIVLEHDAVQDAAAVGMPDPELGERVALYAVPAEGEELTLDEITSFMEEEVAIYKHPERLETVDEIPRNPVGKVLKTELREDVEEKVGSRVD